MLVDYAKATLFVGPSEVLLILLIALLLFGGKKLPELARSLGQAVREFRKASMEIQTVYSTPATDSISSRRMLEQTANSTETMAENMLKETARRSGIEVEGKSMQELSNLIVAATEGNNKTASDRSEDEKQS